MPDQLNEEEQERLRFENEMRKIKLSLEKGAKFIEDPDAPKLPPEIENEFLNYIEQFDKLDPQSAKLTVYEKIGKIEFKKNELVNDNELPDVLEELLEKMEEKGVSIYSIYGINDREMYRFIVDELFNLEIFDLAPMEGMVTQFTYEEFHPNHQEDIKSVAHDFFETFFNTENDYYKYHVEMENNDWFENFRNAYTHFKVNTFEILESNFKDDNATVHFNIEILAFLDDRNTHQFNGKGILELAYSELWLVNKVTLPDVI